MAYVDESCYYATDYVLSTKDREHEAYATEICNTINKEAQAIEEAREAAWQVWAEDKYMDHTNE